MNEAYGNASVAPETFRFVRDGRTGIVSAISEHGPTLHSEPTQLSLLELMRLHVLAKGAADFIRRVNAKS